jgi:signal transduction histidine kinase
MAFSIDWESILINFITNAIHALENVSEIDRKIRIRLSENKEHLRLSFADSGHGLVVGTAERIFLPTFSTKRNRNGDVIGTGMGLAIVQNFVESYGGTIRVESPCDLGGAEFHIEVPLIKEKREDTADG